MSTTTKTPAPTLEKLTGIVERINYYAEDSGYTVAQVKQDNSRNTIKVVGVIQPKMTVNENVEMTGTWEENDKWGRQFKATSCVVRIPDTLEGFEKYLASGQIRGIKHGMARLIVNTFGEDTKKILDKDPTRLLEVPGIGKERMRLITESWQEKTEGREIFEYLHGLGLTVSAAKKIYDRYKKDTIAQILANPYQLAEDVWGIGFARADAIALKTGISPTAPYRIKAATLYTLTEASNTGHTYLPLVELIDATTGLLNVTIERTEVAKMVRELAQEVKVYYDKDIKAVYLASLYDAEVGAARWFSQSLVEATPFDATSDGPYCDQAYTEIDADIRALEQEEGITLSDEQRTSVISAITNKTTILTGSPGTGKTQVSNFIIKYFESKNKIVMLAAPTGRAAKRLSEVSDRKALTIHRLLEFSFADKERPFKRHEYNPLIADVILLDEVSMVDIWLFHQVVRALPSHAHFIMVGDDNQLPSVKAGAVLKDLIATGKVPVMRLSKVFRQDTSNLIALNAQNINAGKALSIPKTPEEKKGSDFIFIECDTNEEIMATILQLALTDLPKHKIPFTDIQILTPQKKTEIGTYALNKAIQTQWNVADDSKKEMLSGGEVQFREGDRVMQVRNNYDKDVFNGDIGVLIEIDEEEDAFKVDYPDKIVVYKLDERDELILAYAQTVHKSQGGEYPVVIMPMSTSHYIMLYRNLFYTGVTRAKKLLIIVGQSKAIKQAINNNKQQHRYSYLGERVVAGVGAYQ